MAGMSMAERTRLSACSCGAPRRCAACAGGMRGHPLAAAGASRPHADRLLIAPQDLRTADPTRASEIYAGRFAFAGKVVISDGRSPFEIEPPSDDWAASCSASAGCAICAPPNPRIARANARALVDEWIALQGRATRRSPGSRRSWRGASSPGSASRR